MSFKKTLILFTLLLMILMIPQAFASDINDTDVNCGAVDSEEIIGIETDDEQIQETSNDDEQVDGEHLSSFNLDAIYISTDGDDYNSGNESAPFKTFYRAVNVAKDNGISNIYVFNGTYKENGIEIDASVNIIGIGDVVIDAEKENRIFKIEGNYEVEISGLTLTNGVAPFDHSEWDEMGYVDYAPGGAIDIIDALVRIQNVTFINNEASEFGGAINVEGEYVYIRNCRFQSNIAGVLGGAIDIEANNATVDNCTFIANEASNGAAIGCIASSAKIINSHFENNVANDTAGAIFIENDELTFDGSNSHLIENNLFINNEAAQQAGAIEVENQQMTSNADWTLIQHNKFINNTAYNGGAISAYYGDAGIKHNLFINNTAGYGGAIASITTTDSNYLIVGGLYLQNNTIINCSAEENGNAIYNMGFIGTYLNITFIEGKTVYSRDGKAIILNVTVCDDAGNLISGTPLDFTVDGKATINPATDLIEGVGSVRFVPRENGTFVVSGVYYSQRYTDDLYDVVTGTLVVENAVADYFGTIYVSDSLGDDDNNGAEDSPVKTFNQAYALATRSGGSFSIVVTKGTYYVPGYTLEHSFNVTGIGNPVLDGRNQKTLFSLYGGPNDEFHFSGLTFKNGIASPSKFGGMEEGGAIFFKGGNLYLNNDIFAANSAKSYGGAVHINKGMSDGGSFYPAFAYIDNCIFNNNLADYFGGAVSIYDCDVLITNSNFTSNSAKKGGAISLLNGMANVTIVNCSFNDNYALEEGGALEINALKTYNVRYHANVIDSIFNGNAAKCGGAIIAGDSNITNCVFISNRAESFGGAVFVNETFLGEAITDQTIIKNSIFDGNTAQKGLAYYGTSILINNNFWANNFNSLSELENRDIISFVERADDLSWVNIQINGLNTIFPGETSYIVEFVLNDGSKLTDYLPDYHVKVSNKLVNNTLDTNNALISQNNAIIRYNATSLGSDTLYVSNVNDNVCITSNDINIADKIEGGNASVSPSGNSQEVIVQKASNLIVPSETFVVTSKSNKITVTLTDDSGNPLSGKSVIFSINGVDSTITTDSQGKATLELKLKVNNYILTVSFKGDASYKPTTKTSTISVVKEKTKLSVPKKTYKKSSKSKKIVITLKSASGKLLAKKKVTFKLNGKKYSKKTNSKGKVTVKVKLTAKKIYKFTVKFAGDSQYRGVSKKSTIKII